MSPAAEARIDADNANQRTWDRSFANWEPGPGDVLLRAYSDGVNRRLLSRWLPERCEHILKTDLFDEVAGDGLVGFLLTRADTVTGVDIAPAVVEGACSRIPALVGAVADVRALPFPDRTFDVVASTSTLDHFDDTADVEQALRELHRVLRPGGTLIVTLDNPANPLVALRNALPYRVLRRIGLVPYPTGTTVALAHLGRLVEEAGFAVSGSGAIMHVPRLAVRAAGRVVVRSPARMDRLVGRLVEVEPPRRLPLGRHTGQFVAIRASRGDGAQA